MHLKMSHVRVYKSISIIIYIICPGSPKLKVKTAPSNNCKRKISVSSVTGGRFTYALVEPLQTLNHHSGRGSAPSTDLAHAIAIMHPMCTRPLQRGEIS